MISKESEIAFNKLIPKIKSIHKDMYSLIEAITKYENGGEFDTRLLASRYSNFDVFYRY